MEDRVSTRTVRTLINHLFFKNNNNLPNDVTVSCVANFCIKYGIPVAEASKLRCIYYKLINSDSISFDGGIEDADIDYAMSKKRMKVDSDDDDDLEMVDVRKDRKKKKISLKGVVTTPTMRWNQYKTALAIQEIPLTPLRDVPIEKNVVITNRKEECSNILSHVDQNQHDKPLISLDTPRPVVGTTCRHMHSETPSIDLRRYDIKHINMELVEKGNENVILKRWSHPICVFSLTKYDLFSNEFKFIHDEMGAERSVVDVHFTVNGSKRLFYLNEYAFPLICNTKDIVVRCSIKKRSM
jgi:hypothetical protein